MTNSELLRDKITSKGLKYAYIAKEIGLSHQSLIRKIDNKTDFKAGEIKALCDILQIETLEEKESIFFI